MPGTNRKRSLAILPSARRPTPSTCRARTGDWRASMPRGSRSGISRRFATCCARRCVVIGEDLGTVPEGFREQMADWGIWSYQVVMFERDAQGRFYGLEHYLPNALITFNTHDLATYAGWRSFSDLRLKRSLGIDPGERDEARW